MTNIGKIGRWYDGIKRDENWENGKQIGKIVNEMLSSIIRNFEKC